MKRPTYGAFATQAEFEAWKALHERALAEHAAANLGKYGPPPYPENAKK